MTKQNNKKPPNQSSQDTLLTVVLFFFNVWSGATTIIGASQVLPKELAFLSGISIQTMLFFLLAGWVMKHSFVRKWLAILAFSAFGVYTSFFCYYNVLTTSVRTRDIRTSSVEAHQVLVGKVLPPLFEKDRQLGELYDQLNRKAKEECNTGLTTGLVGCGPVARDFQRQAIEVSSQRQSIQKLIERLSPKFNYNLDNLAPEDIYKRDVEAFSTVPSQYLPQDFQIKRENYLPKIYDVNFSTPYYKVLDAKNREDTAVFAMLIAILVDGIAIIQGAAIDRGARRYGIIYTVRLKLSRFVRDFKILWFEVTRAAKNSSQEIDQHFEVNNFKKQATNYITNSNLSRDLIYIFILVLTGAIKSSPPHTLDLMLLKDNEHSNNLKEKYNDIFFTLNDVLDMLEQNNFLVNNKDQSLGWLIREHRYSDLMNWLDMLMLENILS